MLLQVVYALIVIKNLAMFIDCGVLCGIGVLVALAEG